MHWLNELQNFESKIEYKVKTSTLRGSFLSIR